jgi:hypothetical protein
VYLVMDVRNVSRLEYAAVFPTIELAVSKTIEHFEWMWYKKILQGYLRGQLMAKMFMVPYFGDFDKANKLIHIGRFLAATRYKKNKDDVKLGPDLSFHGPMLGQIYTVEFILDRINEDLPERLPSPSPEELLIHEFAYNALMGDPAAIDAIKDILKQ